MNFKRFGKSIKHLVTLSVHFTTLLCFEKKSNSVHSNINRNYIILKIYDESIHGTTSIKSWRSQLIQTWCRQDFTLAVQHMSGAKKINILSISQIITTSIHKRAFFKRIVTQTHVPHLAAIQPSNHNLGIPQTIHPTAEHNPNDGKLCGSTRASFPRTRHKSLPRPVK